MEIDINEIKRKATEVGTQMGIVKAAAILAIHKMVSEMGGEIKAEYEDDSDFPPFVSYDGGNHPEYATNLCSRVYSITATDDGVKGFSVEIDECDDYECDRLSYDDILAVFDYVCGKYEKLKQQTNSGTDVD